jgi:hypothetical protein
LGTRSRGARSKGASPRSPSVVLSRPDLLDSIETGRPRFDPGSRRTMWSRFPSICALADTSHVSAGRASTSSAGPAHRRGGPAVSVGPVAADHPVSRGRAVRHSYDPLLPGPAGADPTAAAVAVNRVPRGRPRACSRKRSTGRLRGPSGSWSSRARTRHPTGERLARSIASQEPASADPPAPSRHLLSCRAGPNTGPFIGLVGLRIIVGKVCRSVQ